MFGLLSGYRLDLRTRFREPPEAGVAESFEGKLRTALEAAYLTLSPEGPPVIVTVRLRLDEVTTGPGAPYHVARANARVTIHRARARIRGATMVNRDGNAARDAALDDLIVRLAEAISR